MHVQVMSLTVKYLLLHLGQLDLLLCHMKYSTLGSVTLHPRPTSISTSPRLCWSTWSIHSDRLLLALGLLSLLLYEVMP